MLQSTALEFGLISILRTGHAFYDLLICLVVPTIIQRVLVSTDNNQSVAWLERLLALLWPRQYVRHTVEMTEHVSSNGVVWEMNTRSRNHLLQKAIAAYMAKHLRLDGTPGRYELVRKLEQKTAEQQQRRKAELSIAQWQVGTLPPRNDWVRVDDCIEFMHEVEGKKPDSSTPIQDHKTLYHFRSNRSDGPERIDKLVKKIFAHYQEAERKKAEQDDSRYMYIKSERPPSDEEEDDSKKSAPYHKRYKLGDDKTFDNLFFDGKEQLIEQLDSFTQRTKKFAIEGFPYKFGLLLHGPPGTGKTSIIKAIAHHTERHIVTISLSKIKTNQELLEAMFDLRYGVDGLDLPVKMKFQDVIFVMEDIDCASEVVEKRKDDNEILVEPSAKKIDMYSDDSDDDLLAAFMSMKEFGPEPQRKGGFVSSSNSSDKLNLAGLLNVLDGVIDCPGRMVIMTTNHPEKLDPALIRPGRVSKKLHLSYMSAHQMQLMIEYYCQVKLTTEQRERLKELSAGDRQYTPAEIEELCAEYEDVEAVLREAEGLPQLIVEYVDEEDDDEEENEQDESEEEGSNKADDEGSGGGDDEEEGENEKEAQEAQKDGA